MTKSMVALLQQLRDGDLVLAIVLFLLLSCALCQVLRLVRHAPERKWLKRYCQFAWQIGALLGLEQAYEFTRGQIPHETDTALLNAYRLLDLEWRHGFFVEERLERFFMQFHLLMRAIDFFYVFSHVGVTIGALVWIYVRHRQRYAFVRNLFMLTTAIALIAFYLYPTAPPGMLANYGFIDPLQYNHLVGAGGAQPGSYTYNPYAAMPSLHVGYALIVAWGLIMTERRVFVRAFAALYPLVMGAVVVVSGFHWLLDVAGAFVVVGLSGGFLLCLARLQDVVHVRMMRAAS